MFAGLSGLQILYLIVTLLISVILHEVMHGYTAYLLGDTTASDMGRLTLNPLKHIDIYTTVLLPIIFILLFHTPFFIAKPVPFNPSRLRFGDYGAALVGVAGPLTNFVLAFLGGLLFRLSHAGIYSFLFFFVYVNVGLFIFNMIPFPPLDGSRVLYAFAPDWLREIMGKIEGLGFIAILIFILVIFNFISPLFVSLENSLLNVFLG